MIKVTKHSKFKRNPKIKRNLFMLLILDMRRNTIKLVVSGCKNQKLNKFLYSELAYKDIRLVKLATLNGNSKNYRKL